MLGVAFYPADQGDTASIMATLAGAEEDLATLGETPPELHCVVTNKGYYRADLIKEINVRPSAQLSNWRATRKHSGNFTSTDAALAETKAFS